MAKRNSIGPMEESGGGQGAKEVRAVGGQGPEVNSLLDSSNLEHNQLEEDLKQELKITSILLFLKQELEVALCKEMAVKQEGHKAKC